MFIEAIKSIKKFVFLLIFLFLILILFCNSVVLVKGYIASGKISSQNCQLLRIILYGSSDTPDGETVSAKFSLLDQNGNDIAVIGRSWPDSFLAVDFSTSERKGIINYFPEKIYGTDSVISRKHFFIRKSGTNLIPYYMENRKCLFGISETEQSKMYDAAVFALNPLSFLYSKKYTVNLSLCKTAVYYGIFIENGKLILRKE